MDFINSVSFGQLLGSYWPYLLGLAFLAVMLVNGRSWLAERKQASK